MRLAQATPICIFLSLRDLLLSILVNKQDVPHRYKGVEGMYNNGDFEEGHKQLPV